MAGEGDQGRRAVGLRHPLQVDHRLLGLDQRLRQLRQQAVRPAAGRGHHPGRPEPTAGGADQQLGAGRFDRHHLASVQNAGAEPGRLLLDRGQAGSGPQEASLLLEQRPTGPLELRKSAPQGGLIQRLQSRPDLPGDPLQLVQVRLLVLLGEGQVADGQVQLEAQLGLQGAPGGHRFLSQAGVVRLDIGRADLARRAVGGSDRVGHRPLLE
jgi:hypothetical protein